MRPSFDDVRAALGSRPAAHTEPAASRAAVALLLRDGPGGLELLFVRRAEHPQDPWSGHMAFPGGRWEAGDPDLLATAVRETREEIGLDLHLDQGAELLGALDEVRAMARLRPVDLSIAPYVFRVATSAPLLLGPEVVSAYWLPLERLMGPSLRSTMEYVHQGTVIEFPCIRYEELVIWGLTFRMFLSLEARFA